MSSAWITPAERDEWPNSLNAFEVMYRLRAHAALADEIIEELANRLRVNVRAHDLHDQCDCAPCVTDRDLLNRVDALRNESE